MMSDVKINKNLQDQYDGYYNDKNEEWRVICAKEKGDNILKMAKGYNFSNVLEYGSGDGSILEYLDKNSDFKNLYGVEISKSGIESLKKKNIKKLVEVSKFDGYVLPYKDKEFDMVYCSHVIEHVEFPRILLREIKRVSKYLIIEIPLDYYIGIDKNVKHFLNYGHIDIYTPSTFKFLLKSEKFKILKQLHTNPSEKIIQYQWFVNQQQNKSLKNLLKLKSLKLKQLLKKIIFTKKFYKENSFSAYTCLCVC